MGLPIVGVFVYLYSRVCITPNLLISLLWCKFPFTLMFLLFQYTKLLSSFSLFQVDQNLIPETTSISDTEQRKMNDAEPHRMNDAEQHKMNVVEQHKMNDTEQNGGILGQIRCRFSQLNKFTIISKSNRLCRSVYTVKQNNLKQKLVLKTFIRLIEKFCFL